MSNWEVNKDPIGTIKKAIEAIKNAPYPPVDPEYVAFQELSALIAKQDAEEAWDWLISPNENLSHYSPMNRMRLGDHSRVLAVAKERWP